MADSYGDLKLGHGPYWMNNSALVGQIGRLGIIGNLLSKLYPFKEINSKLERWVQHFQLARQRAIFLMCGGPGDDSIIAPPTSSH